MPRYAPTLPRPENRCRARVLRMGHPMRCPKRRQEFDVMCGDCAEKLARGERVELVPERKP